MICRNIFLTLFFSASNLLFNFVSAQNMVAKLSDAEIRTVIPILKTEIAGYAKLMKGMEKENDIKHQLFLDIQSGKTDPLDWLKQYSKHIIVPPGAIYLPECSRSVSIKMSELLKEEPGIRSSAVPTAIFTFGKDFPAINKHLLGDDIAADSYNRFVENPYDATDPSVDKLRLFIKDADLFYTKNGFSIYYSPWDFLPVATVFSFSHPEDEEHISGFVSIFDFTLFDPLFPDVIKQCRSHVMGPVVEISVDQKYLDEILSSSDITMANDEDYRNSLKNSGITEDRYALVKASLIIARRDSENPEGIEVPSLDFTPTTLEEKEMAKVITMMKEDALARKSNITIYNKFKTELDPILDCLP